MASVDFSTSTHDDKDINIKKVEDRIVDPINNSGNISTNNNLNTLITSTSLNNIELEYNRITTDRNGWQRLYQEIRDACDREAAEKHFATIEAEKSENRALNRYRDVNPYDHSRIIIQRGSVNYINANLVKVEKAKRRYILTQGPLGDTVGHFWMMVWEQNTKAILMLNKLMEKEQVKCHKYWPERKGDEHALKLNDVNLIVEFLYCEEYKHFIHRRFKLTDLESQQSREIIQFHYITWPDFGIPSSPVAFLQFLKQVRDSGALNSDMGPAVVHCSAGIGRSGTFCLVDCCLVLSENQNDANVSVQDVLYELRRYRMGLIQTADQLYFSYQAIIEGIKLLKNQEFINNKEIPIIHEADECSTIHLESGSEDTPPPLPPRTHSLLPIGDNGSYPTNNVFPFHKSTQNNTSPNTPSNLNDKFFVSENSKEDNNVILNIIDNDKVLAKPLPPLPHSLHRVFESDSDGYEESEDKSNNINTMMEYKSENCSNSVKGNSLGGGHLLQESVNETANDNKLDVVENIEDIKLTDKLEKMELRRRKRIERQEQIEQKVLDIKRKHRETEESIEYSAKKRKSLITCITAGVIVGVICVYAYSKWT